MFCSRFVLGSFLALCLAAPSVADDYGVIGPIYPIAEPDLLQSIHAKLKQKQDSGELQVLQLAAQKRATDGIENPIAVAGLGATKVPRTYYYDPTILVPYNITDTKGTIIVPKGTTKNPLDVVSLSETLVFFDASDANQLARVKALPDNESRPYKYILVAGSYMHLMRQWKRQVYFDQQGILIKRFNIKNVPALVYQEGKKLRIDEIVS